jgi:ATP-dependent DNA helicase RecQ
MPGTAPTDDATLRDSLERTFGFSEFRPHQLDIVRAIVSGRDVFAALPTGGGKSLCYQLPAVVRGGLTVVVSPLISLMKDQVDAARTNGIPAAYLNSSLEPDEAQRVWQALRAGTVQLLYAAPERLSKPAFRGALSQLRVSLVAIDEAHCISEWGHEFRPDYRTLGELRRDLPDVPIAAFTATATKQVQSDVIRQLGLAEPLRVRGSFDRREISYRVEPKEQVDRQILQFVRRHEGEPGIIYRSTRRAVEETAGRLATAGVRAAAYHAGLEDAERRRTQEAFLRDEITVVVATIAFGMGIDKPNVRWVVHGDLPKSIESYYQETGRAARDGEPAETVLFYGGKDISTIRYHIDRMENDTERERAEQQLDEMLRFVDSGLCRRKLLLAHFDEEHPGNCGNCDVCTGDVEQEDYTVAAQKILSAAVRTGQRFGGHHLADVVCGIASDRVTQLRHDQLPTFGVGADRSKEWWLALLRDLESGGLLRRNGGRASGFQVTSRGRLVLKGKEPFLALRRTDTAGKSGGDNSGGGVDTARSRGNHATGAGTADSTSHSNSAAGGPHSGASPAGGRNHAAGGPATAPGIPLRQDQKELLDCLKQLRTSIARRRGVPPYVVFSDKSLRSMAQIRPTDRPAFRRCHGVGERKLEEFGDTFLRTITAFLDGEGCPEE